jgi:hypothetical protein
MGAYVDPLFHCCGVIYSFLYPIEKATDNGASAGNLALHLQICDVINETDTG